jgi:HSP20 family molecular chaperone IbpA
MQIDVGSPGLACEVTDNQSVLRVWLPGTSLDLVRVALHGDRLTIWGTTLDDESELIGQPGHFCHSVRLPNPVNLARTTVEYRHGELTVTLPHARGRLRLPHEVASKATPRSINSLPKPARERRLAAVS